MSARAVRRLLTAVAAAHALTSAACSANADAKAASDAAESFSRRYSGPIGAPEQERIARTLRRGTAATLLVLDSVSVFTCEDLGRQLRELQRTAVARGQPTLVATPRRDSLVVSVWLARERITVTAQLSVGDSLTVGDAPVGAPAVLLTDSAHHVTAGIMHTLRVNNTRTLSFAYELGLR